jgi:hypothetical protein
MGKRGQRFSRPKRATVVSCEPSDLAPEERQRLYYGLERFVNAGDGPEEYKALSKAWSSFWPLDLQDGPGDELAWTGACHRLFLVYRDTLRRVWISDPDALRGGALNFLLGLTGWEITLPSPQGWQLREARDRIEETYARATVVSHTVVYPHWKSGVFTYSPHDDFQRALYVLFRESWRAKVCARCSTYFVAQKPAQLYCGIECSNASHKKAALKWWKEKGVVRRAAQAGHRRKRNKQ